MRPSYFTPVLLLFISLSARSQNAASLSLNIGDSAPQLRVREWMKGTPVQRFEKGKIYVLEFWATWCQPCIASMPRLSVLAREFKEKVTVIGIDVYEFKKTTIQKVKAFVDSMSNRMDFYVAAQDSDFMVTDWLEASATKGIPTTFVINAEGRLAWIGHPRKLAEVLPQIVDNTWNIKEALLKRNSDMRLAELDKEASYDLMAYRYDSFKQDFVPRPDSALLAIDEMVRKEPKLKYAPSIAYNTFFSLLKTDPHKAYEYGRLVLVTSSYEEPAYSSVYNPVDLYSDTSNLPLKIYRLGAEAYQMDIDNIPYPEIASTQKLYHRMAYLYWRANEKTKAIDAEQKAIETLKKKKDFSKAELAAFELQLQHYKKK